MQSYGNETYTRSTRPVSNGDVDKYDIPLIGQETTNISEKEVYYRMNTQSIKKLTGEYKIKKLSFEEERKSFVRNALEYDSRHLGEDFRSQWSIMAETDNILAAMNGKLKHDFDLVLHWRGMTREDLVEITGYSLSTISHIINKRQNTHFIQMFHLCFAIHSPVSIAERLMAEAGVTPNPYDPKDRMLMQVYNRYFYHEYEDIVKFVKQVQDHYRE